MESLDKQQAEPANSAMTRSASRAMNIDETMQIVAALCDHHKIGISTIEPLASGGTRVVLNTLDEAESLRRRLKGRLIAGPVVRSSLHVARQPVPFT